MKDAFGSLSDRLPSRLHAVRNLQSSPLPTRYSMPSTDFRNSSNSIGSSLLVCQKLNHLVCSVNRRPRRIVIKTEYGKDAQLLY